MIEYAGWEMRRDLAALWQECFHDPKRYPEYFLNNIFLPRNTLVYRAGQELAAAVYLIPAQLLTRSGTVPAHYIFAAATAPKFRSHGYMSSLLAYAALAGAARGDCCSILLPSDDGLYRFYAAAGYKDFFRVRMAEVSAETLKAASDREGCPGQFLPDMRALNFLRRKVLTGNSGSMLWDDRMFHFSVGMNVIYGDRMVTAVKGGKSAYALCHREESICTVLEAAADTDTFPALSAAVLRDMPAESYRFRLPENSPLFSGAGECMRFGMIKPLGGWNLSDAGASCPYLGLTMD